MEDSKQLILEGQHHVILRTIGKEAFSYPQKQVITEFALGLSCELVGGCCLIVFCVFDGVRLCRLLFLDLSWGWWQKTDKN